MNHCSNCQSHRRPIQTAGLCAKCYPWHRRRKGLQEQLSATGQGPRFWQRRFSLRYRLRVADRVLAEYAWREMQLQDTQPDPIAVLALLCAVAGECRSELEPSVESDLSLQSPEALHCFFRILLEIVENIPAKRPRLHTLEAPKRGQYPDAWLDWARDCR